MSLRISGTWIACTLLLPLALDGCAALPGIDTIEAEAARVPAQPADLRQAAGADAGLADRIARVEAAVAKAPLIAGNRVELLKDGPATHERQLAAIAAARGSIHLSIYIFTDDRLGGRYARALAAKARAGVKVRVIVDGLGGREAIARFARRMEGAGVELRQFNDTRDWRVWRLVHRNHQKVLVVDDALAFTGGINIADDYLSSPGGQASASSGASPAGSGGKVPKHGWRDTQVLVRGPAVAAFQRLFLEAWRELGDPAPHAAARAETPAAGDGHWVRLVQDEGEDLLDAVASPLRSLDGGERVDNARIYATQLSAIHQARRRIWITQAYYAPDATLTRELIAAARRGVDVRLLLPGGSDVKLMTWAAHARYARLLEAGVRIWQYRETSVLHAKTAVVDGVWSTVGSANLDYRSFIFNDEANVTVISRDFARRMEAMFSDDLKASTEITAEAWAQRPAPDRVREFFALAISRFL